MPRTGTRDITVRGASAIEEGVGITPPNYKLYLANTQLEEEQGTEMLPPQSEGICIQGETRELRRLGTAKLWIG